MDDDFELEVTDLDTGATVHHSLANNAHNDHNGSNEPGGDDDDLPPRTTTPQQRRLRTAIVSGVVLLAVVFVLLINPAAKSSLYTVFRFPTPVPSPTPPPGSDLIFMVRGAPWGIVKVDGKQTASANLGTTATWIKLAPGHHTVVVTQPPFPTLHCVISFPAASGDNCPLVAPPGGDNQPYGDGLTFPSGGRFVDLGARFSLLPHDEQDALVAAVTAQLQPSGAPLTLEPGDHYLRDDGSVAVAQTTLQATYNASVLTPDDAIASDSLSCVSFCDMTGVGNGNGGAWNMTVTLLGSWRITTPTGQVITEHAPMYSSDPAYQTLPLSMQAMMSILWTGHWQTSARDEFGYAWSPSCQEAQQMLSSDLATNNIAILGLGEQYGPTPEWGCVLNLTLGDPTQSAPLYVYYHLGVLLAANSAASQAFPKLPVASVSERALTQQVLARPTS